ncbi:MAG TPA: apolipoprotein N-acyltransferase [Gemmataceae bacterium]
MPRAVRRKHPAAVPAPTSPVGPRTGLRCLGAALVSAGLLWLCYFPANCGWLAWVALVPWLMLVRAELPTRRHYLITYALTYPLAIRLRIPLPKSRYSIAWLAGLALYVPALAWMRTGYTEMVVFWLLLALYCSWYFPLALWLVRRLDARTRLPLTLTVPLVWTALEYVRGWLAGGFAWYFLGHTQHDFLPAIQVADLAGVAAVTFLVAAVNGLLAEAAGQIPAVRAWFNLSATDLRPAVRWQAVAVAAALLLTLGYGGWRLTEGEFPAGPRVALLQPSIPQTERNAASVDEAGDPLARASIDEQMATLSKRAVRAAQLPDLVIWPETTFPYERKEVAPGAPDSNDLTAFRKDLADRAQLAKEQAELAGTNVLLGLNTRTYGADGKIRRYNTALLLTRGGEVVGRYDKMHLVPFGEYIPLKDELPFVAKLSPYGSYDYTLTPGEAQTRFSLTVGDRTYHFGVVICYEDADAPLARGLVKPSAGPPADFLVNTSNDGWFMGTAEHAEHLAISRFRAVECRRAVVRAVNGGISAVIDGNGRVVALPAESWAKSHSVTGVVTAAVPLDTRTSLYARLGDWLPWTCWGVVLVGCWWRPKAHPIP